jgi:predicted RNase H-like HicB family nuclease
MQVVALIDEDDGRFGVAFPDFPGCTTVGANLDEAVAKAEQALAFHVEGLAEDGPLPQPRTLMELRQDAEFRRDAKDAAIVLIPYEPPSRAVRLNITLEESLVARIDKAAAAAGESRSGFLATAARRRLAESV